MNLFRDYKNCREIKEHFERVEFDFKGMYHSDITVEIKKVMKKFGFIVSKNGINNLANDIVIQNMSLKGIQ